MNQPSFSPSISGGLASNQELANLFEEYLNDARTILLKKLQAEEKNCMASNNDNPDNYAKCMYAFQKDMKDHISNLNFRTTFLKRKMEECMESTIYRTNKEEGTKHCIKSAKVIIEKLIKSI